jgi:hypothetical protein
MTRFLWPLWSSYSTHANLSQWVKRGPFTVTNNAILLIWDLHTCSNLPSVLKRLASLSGTTCLNSFRLSIVIAYTTVCRCPQMQNIHCIQVGWFCRPCSTSTSTYPHHAWTTCTLFLLMRVRLLANYNSQCHYMFVTPQVLVQSWKHWEWNCRRNQHCLIVILYNRHNENTIV